MDKYIIKFVLDRKGLISDYHCPFYEPSYYTKKEVLGKNWFDFLVSPDDYEKSMKHFLYTLYSFSNKKEEYKCHMKLKDGKDELFLLHNEINKLDNQQVIIKCEQVEELK